MLPCTLQDTGLQSTRPQSKKVRRKKKEKEHSAYDFRRIKKKVRTKISSATVP